MSGSALCSPCPAGHECQNNIGIKCAPGTYSLSGDGMCMECPPGFHCPRVDLGPQVCNLICCYLSQIYVTFLTNL